MPAMSMFMLQFTYAGLALSTKQALLQGMSPRVFIFYRHAIATLVIAPIAYFSRYLYIYIPIVLFFSLIYKSL